VAKRPTANIKPNKALRAFFEARGGVTSSIARKSMERYRRVIQASLVTARRKLDLTEGQAKALCEFFRDDPREAEYIRLVGMELQDAVEKNTSAALSSLVPEERESLVERMRSLSEAELIAVWDAIERYWLNGQDAREVGLVE